MTFDDKDNQVSEGFSKYQIHEADNTELNYMLPENNSENEEISGLDLNIESDIQPERKTLDSPLANPVAINDEKRYIFDLLKAIEKNKIRVLSTLSNVKNSRIYELTGEPTDSKNIIADITREFETEIFRIIDNFQNKFKEMTAFPKSIPHYSMNYSLAQKDFLGTLENDKVRMDYILRWEMQEPGLILLKKFSKMVEDLLSILNLKEEEQIKTLSFQMQTLFRDSKSATEYCLNDLEFLKRSIEAWKQSAV